MIFYLRCAAYLRPLPRTPPQNQRAQTHSRGRAMLAPMTKINLPPCLGVFISPCSIYTMPIYMPHRHIGSSNQYVLYCTHKLRSMPLTIREFSQAICQRYLNNSIFHRVNRENEESCQDQRFSERLSFTRFCANGNRPAFIGGGSERDETAVKRW